MRSNLQHKLSAVRNSANTLIGHRGKQIIKTSGWSLVAKFSSALSVFFCIPFALNALGDKYFGAWVTIISIFTFSSFLDFGIGNGAMNLISDAKGKNNVDKIYKIANQSLAISDKLIFGLFLIFTVLTLLLPWHKILGLEPNDVIESIKSIAIIFIALLLSVQINLVARLQLGLGKGHKAYKLFALGQLASIPAVIFISQLSPSLPTLVAASTITPLFFLLKNTYEFRKKYSTNELITFNSDHTSSNILKSGVGFFILQLIAVVAFNSDLLLISANLGAEVAGQFSIVQRIFSVLPILMGIVWSSLWPAYTESLSNGDHQWAIKTFKISTFFLIMFSIFAGSFLAIFINDISSLWIENQSRKYEQLAWGFVIWNLTFAIGSSIAVILNSANIIKFQIITFGAFAVIVPFVKIYVMNMIGIEQINVYSAGMYLLFCIAPAFICLPMLKKNIKTGQITESVR